MDVQAQISDISNQLATGEFKVPPPKEKPVIPLEEQRDRRVLNNLKQRWRVYLKQKGQSTAGKIAKGVFSVSRTFETAGDMGAGLIQGIVLAPTHPKRFGQAWRKAYTSYWSQGDFEAMDYKLRTEEAQYNRDRAGLFMHDKEMGVLEGESDLAHKILKLPGMGLPRVVIDAGERFYSTFVNHFRAGMFDDFMRRNPNATLDEMKAEANYLNVFTRRGSLGDFRQAAEVLSYTFFAPRFAVSAFEIPFKTAFGYRKYPRVRKDVMKSMLGFAATSIGAMVVAKLAGFDVETDPDKSDFGRVIIGNTRIDFTGGLAQTVRIFARTGLIGTDRLGLTGKGLKKPRGKFDPIEALSQFAMMRINPSIQLGKSLWTGLDWRHKPISPGNAIIEAFTPLFIQDAADAWKTDGWMAGVGAGVTSFSGVRITTWRPDAKPSVPPSAPDLDDLNLDLNTDLDLNMELGGEIK
jgi:hypothetical protein